MPNESNLRREQKRGTRKVVFGLKCMIITSSRHYRLLLLWHSLWHRAHLASLLHARQLPAGLCRSLQLLHQKINVCVYFLSKYISQKFAKVKPKRLLFWKPFTSSFQKCLSFLDFLRYCTMGKARAFRKGLFNRSYGAFSFGKNFLLSTFILVLLKALWKLLLSQYTTIYYFIHHSNKHPITVR